MIPKDKFDALFSGAGLTGDYERFSVYCGMLQDWNRRMNLTAITDDQGIAVKHFLDSVLPLTLWDLPQGTQLVDVGTGAGFPSLPMRLVRDDLDITLLDSQQKRLDFLEAVCGALDIPARRVHLRAEEAGRSAEHRGRYDAAASRAVAAMGLLAEYCLPLLRTGGVLLAMKGSGGKAEAQEGRPAIEALGGRIRQVREYALPGGDRRTLVVVEKVKDTPSRYPRTAAQLAKEKRRQQASAATPTAPDTPEAGE